MTEPDSESVASQPAGEALDPDLSLSDLRSSEVSSWIVSRYRYCCETAPFKKRSASATEENK